jgi:hypothetical protein
LQIKTIIVSCHTADSKAVKQEVNGTVILPLLVLPGLGVSATATAKVVSGAKGSYSQIFGWVCNVCCKIFPNKFKKYGHLKFFSF